MQEEKHIKEMIQKKKHDQAEMIQKRKEQAFQRAKQQQMTEDQLLILEESKAVDSHVDQDKLNEAQKLAA